MFHKFLLYGFTIITISAIILFYFYHRYQKKRYSNVLQNDNTDTNPIIINNNPPVSYNVQTSSVEITHIKSDDPSPRTSIQVDENFNSAIIKHKTQIINTEDK